MSIKDKIDDALLNFRYNTGKYPKRVVLSPRALGNFVYELGEYTLGQVTDPPGRCPHCGKSLLTYMGMSVEAMTDKDVFVE